MGKRLTAHARPQKRATLARPFPEIFATFPL